MKIGSTPKLGRWLAHHLPTTLLKDGYPRAMRRLAEWGLVRGSRICDTNYGFQMYAGRLDALEWCVYYYGEWEPSISTVIKHVLPRGGTMIDIGSNVGYTALLGASIVGPEGLIVAFEPSAKTFERLEANIALNGYSNVKAVKAAIAEQDGEATLHCLADNESIQASLHEREGVVRTENVATLSARTALKNIEISDIDLIKIDVEGGERAIISSLEPFIPHLKQSCVLLIEVSPNEDANDVLKPFLSRGFQSKRISNTYSTRSYRKEEAIQIGPILSERCLQDTILTRDEFILNRVQALSSNALMLDS